MKERLAAFQKIVSTYRQHPTVLTELEQYSSGYTPTQDKLDDTDPLSRLMADMGRYRLLTARDEAVLFSLIEQGLAAYSKISPAEITGSKVEHDLIMLTAAYQILYACNMRLVVQIAKQYNFPTYPVIERIHDGLLGLSRAAMGFDVSRGHKFSTYATHWIRQAITRAIADKGRGIRLPAHAHEDWLRIRRVTSELTRELKRPPKPKEIAGRVGLPEKTVVLLQHFGDPNNEDSLDELVREEINGSPRGDFIANENDPLEREVANVGTRDVVLKLIKYLDPRERAVICMRQGLYIEEYEDQEVETAHGQMRRYADLMANVPPNEGLTLEVVGKEFGITRERIRQIESKAMLRLQRLAANFGITKEEYAQL